MSTNPKYKTYDTILLKSGRRGMVDFMPVIHPEYNCWYYTYSYGLGGTSEGSVLEYDIDHIRTKKENDKKVASGAGVAAADSSNIKKLF